MDAVLRHYKHAISRRNNVSADFVGGIARKLIRAAPPTHSRELETIALFIAENYRLSLHMSSPEYIPGTCNIGPAEIRKRRTSAFVALGLLVVMAAILILFTNQKPLRFLLIFPAAAFGVSALQWLLKFCVMFGLKGILNFGDLGTTDTVEQKEFRRKDLAKARLLIALGILIGAAITAGIYFLPV